MNYSIFTLFLLIFLSTHSLEAKDTQKLKPKGPHKVYQHTKKERHSVCSKCHEMREGKKHFHMPVRVGACTVCHNLSVKTKDLLRIKNGPELCILCHDSKRKIIRENKNVHPSVLKACTGCHDPHAGNFQYRLKANKRKDLCLTCHIEKKKWVNSVKNKHGAIFLKNGGCIACHDPHGTGRKRMLRADTTRELCLRCHNKSLRRDEDWKMLLNMDKKLKENKKWHGPIIKGNCVGCHNPHGSNNHRMLRGPYPSTSTTKFSPDKYVCFICHDSKKITEASTQKYTNFRRGRKNLHTIHVKKNQIVCGTCHDFHAVDRDVPLLKKMTKFGTATFNLNYEKLPNGGACNPICHERREYNRKVKPMQ